MPVKLNKIVRSKLHEILSFLTKYRVFRNHFWQSVNAILEDVSVAEAIVSVSEAIVAEVIITFQILRKKNMSKKNK